MALASLVRSTASYVRARWAGWVFLAVLAAGAVFSARIALQSKPFDMRMPLGPSLKHEPDFEATGLTVWRTTADGKGQSQLRAAHMVHYRDDLSSVYDKPQYELQKAGVKTKVQADTATSRNDDEEVALIGRVNLSRAQSGKPLVVLQTPSLVAWPDTGKVVGRSPTLLTQGGRSIQSKGGFDYLHSEAETQFAGPVRMVINPAKPKK